jgi:hypothetical protein
VIRIYVSLFVEFLEAVMKFWDINPELRSWNRNWSESYSFGDSGTGTGTVFGIQFRFLVLGNEAKN